MDAIKVCELVTSLMENLNYNFHIIDQKNQKAECNDNLMITYRRCMQAK